MAVSKSMSFPNEKKLSYSDQVTINQGTVSPENTLQFLPVPGPMGPQGPKGEPGVSSRKKPMPFKSFFKRKAPQ